MILLHSTNSPVSCCRALNSNFVCCLSVILCVINSLRSRVHSVASSFFLYHQYSQTGACCTRLGTDWSQRLPRSESNHAVSVQDGPVHPPPTRPRPRPRPRPRTTAIGLVDRLSSILQWRHSRISFFGVNLNELNSTCFNTIRLARLCSALWITEDGSPIFKV